MFIAISTAYARFKEMSTNFYLRSNVAYLYALSLVLVK